MEMSRNMRRAAGAAAFAAMVPVMGSAIAQAPEAQAKPLTAVPDAAQIERRLQSVRTLLEGSSAARQIEASGNPQAQGLRSKSRQLLRLAEDAVAARDYRSASSLLDDAARQLFEGARLASGEAGRAGSLPGEVNARIEVARALLAAQKRISAEKGAPGGAEASRQIEQLLARASSHAAAERYAEARPLAQQAYLLAKAAIGSMRSGDTLVRSLDFASKEEEYHYEIDRNDTHRMLLELLAKRQSEAGGAFAARALQLRQQAVAHAGRGDFGAAVGLLEEATRELVRAIRSAGVFIPG